MSKEILTDEITGLITKIIDHPEIRIEDEDIKALVLIALRTIIFGLSAEKRSFNSFVFYCTEQQKILAASQKKT